MIDKVEIVTLHTPNISPSIVQKSENPRHRYSYYANVPAGNGLFQFMWSPRWGSEQEFCRVICNPSHMSVDEFEFTYLTGFKEADDFGQFIIKRIDIAVDLPIPICELKMALHFKRPRRKHEYFLSNRLQGAVYGKRPSRYLLYDKRWQMQLGGGEPLTRLEAQLHKGCRFLPIKSMEDLLVRPKVWDFLEPLEFLDIARMNRDNWRERTMAASFKELGVNETVRGMDSKTRRLYLHHLRDGSRWEEIVQQHFDEFFSWRNGNDFVSA